MNKLLSGLAAAVTLLAPLPSLGGGTTPHSSNTGLQARERLALALQRQAQHQRALALGDPSRSPYFRIRGPVGQSGSRHDEHAWYAELISRG